MCASSVTERHNETLLILRMRSHTDRCHSLCACVRSAMARPLDSQEEEARLALVTGSTSGIGLGIAQALARKGHEVVLHGLGTPEVIQSAIQSCRDVLPGSIPPSQ